MGGLSLHRRRARFNDKRSRRAFGNMKQTILEKKFAYTGENKQKMEEDRGKLQWIMA